MSQQPKDDEMKQWAAFSAGRRARHFSVKGPWLFEPFDPATCAESLAREAFAAWLVAAPKDPVGNRIGSLEEYLREVADLILDMNGACAHDWLVGVAKHIKSQLQRIADDEVKRVAG